MKHYPYFIADALLLILLVLVIPLGALYLHYGIELPLVSVLVFALIFHSNIGKIKDFEGSVKNIKGIDSWESDFFSLGCLIFDYKGEELNYCSMLRGKSGKDISVDYLIDASNNSKKELEIINVGEGWLNEFSVSGDKKTISSIKKEFSAFNKKYRIESLKNSKGKLHIAVNLRFMPGKPPSKKKKLEDMTAFLQDYLEFAYNLNKKLKKGK